MENIIYNELIIRGYNVDVGVVEVRDENKGRKQLEVDFVCNQGNKRYYVQVALNIDTREKNLQESRLLNNIGDNFKKSYFYFLMLLILLNGQKNSILILGFTDAFSYWGRL